MGSRKKKRYAKSGSKKESEKKTIRQNLGLRAGKITETCGAAGAAEEKMDSGRRRRRRRAKNCRFRGAAGAVDAKLCTKMQKMGGRYVVAITF